MSNNVSFYDNFIPTLKAGEYTVHVSQALTPAAGSSEVPTEPQSPIAQKFIVRGPRFQLDPADVHRVFPPAGGTGVYDEYMPMIVLNKRALPWERELNLTTRNSACRGWRCSSSPKQICPRLVQPAISVTRLARSPSR